MLCQENYIRPSLTAQSALIVFRFDVLVADGLLMGLSDTPREAGEDGVSLRYALRAACFSFRQFIRLSGRDPHGLKYRALQTNEKAGLVRGPIRRGRDTRQSLSVAVGSLHIRPASRAITHSRRTFEATVCAGNGPEQQTNNPGDEDRNSTRKLLTTFLINYLRRLLPATVGQHLWNFSLVRKYQVELQFYAVLNFSVMGYERV